ncbi:DUF4831 family protein [Flavobacterium lindanitolerans]|uniref:DUF4831 family protein n=1 Tax=Flavobacterium lindanitolerans TaxID=428988 RepID=UPI0027B9DFF9|nr:DUF4831 family protein [Flavobacterium lindanitolerans]MDQ7959809.1 DUF4831 family protein [Flavobacterium lindanitolerans]
MKKIITLFAIILLWSCSTVRTSQLNSTATSTKNGFYYALPKTILIVSFEIEKKTVEDGDFSKYARCFDIKKKDSSGTSFKIKNIEITSRSILDETKVYQMNMSRNFLNKNDFSLEYSKEGELTSSDIKNENQIIPLISTIVNYATLVPGLATLKGDEKKAFTTGLDLCSKTEEKEYRLAKEKYDRIIQYESMQDKILENSDGSGKEVVDFKLQKVKQLRDELLSDFTGKITTKTVKVQFEIDPEKMITKKNNVITYNKIMLLSVNKTEGIKMAPEFSNYVNTGFENNQITPTETMYVQVQKIEKGIGEAVGTNNKREGKASFYYNIPAETRFQILKITNSTSTVEKQTDLMIPQYGIVAAAPSNMKNTTFKLHPGLGSILSVSGTTATVDLEKLNAIPEKASDILDKFKKEEPVDPKDKLIRQLEQDVRIQELQNKLNSTSE